MRSISFLVGDLSDVRITIFELDDGSIQFDITSESGAALDLRALYFDLNEAFENLSGGLSITGDHIAATTFGDDDVTQVGSGTSINGTVVNEYGAYDVGVGFADTQEDLTSISFTISHDSEALDLDMFSLSDIGLRLDGGDPKIGDVSSMALLAVDDAFQLDENTTLVDVNLLANDRQSDGLRLSGLTIGGVIIPLDAWTEVTTDGGRTALVFAGTDGSLQVVAGESFDDLNINQTDTLTLNYSSVDAYGSRDGAEVSITINGVNDAPTVAAPLTVRTEEDIALRVDLLEGASDVDLGSTLDVVEVVEDTGQGGWTLDGTEIVLDPAYFNSLNQGTSATLTFTYFVQDEWGARVQQTLELQIDGLNDAPTVAGALTRQVSEEDAVFTVFLLAGARDPDRGATLSAVNLTEASGQGGWTLDGNTITIDPNYFDDLNDGELGVLHFNYLVQDEFNGTVEQTLTVNVEGYTDAPFIAVEIAAGDTANVVLLTVTTEQARDERVALSFSGLPAGAIVRNAAGEDVTSGVPDGLGVTTYVVTLPLNQDLESFNVTVAGLEPDGTVIGTRDAVIELNYEAVETTNTLTFQALDQNIWAAGDEFAATFSQYIPLLGGDRKYFELTDATTNAGTVFIKNGEIEWILGDSYSDLLPGETAEVTFTFYYIETDENGVPLPSAIATEETMTVLATGGNSMTEFSGEYLTIRDGVVTIDALRTVDALDNPLSTGLLTLIDISLNSDDIFASVINPLKDARDAFAGQLLEEERKLAQAILDRDAVFEEVELLTILMAQRAEVAARQLVYNTANFAVNALDDALGFFEDALDAAERALSSAQSRLNSAKSATASAKSAYLDSIVTVFGVQVGDPIKYAIWKAAEAAQAIAQGAVNLASEAVDLAQEALDAFIADSSLDFLQQQVDNALAALNEAKADVAATEQVLEDRGYYADATTADAGDLLRATGELTLAQGEVLLYEGTTLGLEALLATAQGLVDGVQALIDTTDLQALLYASAEAYAQAGLQFDFSVSGGSVDAAVEYNLTTVSGYNETTDVMTITVGLESMTTDGDIAFSTVSPNVQIYAGLLYDLGANFEFVADFYAAINTLVLADLSPNSDGVGISPSVHLEGSIDFVDFDSRDGDSLTFGIGSGTTADLLEFTLGVPTIETLGTETDPSLAFFTEGDLLELDFDELLGAVRSLVEARIELSPEMQALLNQAGIDPADPANGEFIEALVQGLSIALGAAIGEGDTDGDGVVPIFLLDATDETNGALLHINTIADDTSGINEDSLGQFGFYAAYGESGNIFEVTLDVDQLIAVIANRALANPTPIVFNPVDLEFGIEDALEIAGVDQETRDKIEEWFNLSLNAEFLDLDVTTGLNFSQEFTLSLDDFDFKFTMEDGTEFFTTASDPTLNITNASQYDANGDGRIDYNLTLTPNASFSNDTELGLGFSYALDVIKTSLSAGINIPLNAIFGTDIDIFGLGDDSIELDLFNSAIGPLFRVQGDIDAVTLDLFEDRFEINFGTQSVDLSSDEFQFV
jgi:VCBS repeat-containing protein